jgi:hypothetical protein
MSSAAFTLRQPQLGTHLYESGFYRSDSIKVFQKMLNRQDAKDAKKREIFRDFTWRSWRDGLCLRALGGSILDFLSSNRRA